MGNRILETSTGDADGVGTLGAPPINDGAPDFFAEQLYDAYKRTSLSPSEFEGPKYRRIDQIQQLLAAGALDSTLRWTGSAVSRVAARR